MVIRENRCLRGLIVAAVAWGIMLVTTAIVFAEEEADDVDTPASEVMIAENVDDGTMDAEDEVEETEEVVDEASVNMKNVDEVQMSTDDENLINAGVEEKNEAYDFTIDTEADGVSASAGISSGGWDSLGSELSYMEFPKDAVSDDGKDGLWCYCIDISTTTKDEHKYSMTTLDAAGYYDKEAADKIRSILINSYPNIDVDKLGAAYSMTDLTEEEAFMATQWILWYYSNPGSMVDAGGGHYYPADIYKPSDYPREVVTIWYDDENGNEVRIQSANVVTLAKALDALRPAEAYETEPAEIMFEKKIYKDKVVFDYSGTVGIDTLENIKITVKDKRGADVPFVVDGTRVIVKYEDMEMTDDGIELAVSMEAVQTLSKDVYFFAPEGGRDASQSRVAVYSGTVPVANTAVFTLTKSDFEEAENDPDEEVKEPIEKSEEPLAPEKTVPSKEAIEYVYTDVTKNPTELNETYDSANSEVLAVSTEPQTGDDSNVQPFMLLVLAALTGAAAMLFRRKKL